MQFSMSRRNCFFRLTLSIFFYILFCIVVIVIKMHYFSSVFLEFKTQNLNNNNNNNKNESELLVKIANYDKYENNLNIAVENIKSIDLTIDMAKIDSTIERIFNVCEKYNKIIPLQRKNFLYSSKHNTLFCWIRKIASKSFTKFFADLRNVQIVGDTYARETESLGIENTEDLTNVIDDRDVFKFLAVRHPFERLVASYRDRIEDNSKYTDQAWLYVPKIFHITRPSLFHHNQSSNPLEQIFYYDRRLKIIPTFAEFIVWLLLQPESIDDHHWNQYYSHCSICQISYDYVLKIDNYALKDINYIFTNIGLDKTLEFPRIGKNRKVTTNFDITCIYLSALTQETFHKLYERYQIDFEMFDYHFKMYEGCVKNK